MRSKFIHSGLTVIVSIVMASTILAQIPDPEIVAKIKDEGLNRSQVMQTVSYLTDVIGPRLTASPNMKRANEWTRDKFTSWGLQNAHLEAWGPFGRGWAMKSFSAEVVSPQEIPLIAYPKAWSPGFRRPITADVILFDAKTEEDLAQYKGKLAGKIVLNGAVTNIDARFKPQGARYTDEELAAMEKGEQRGVGTGGAPRPPRLTPPSGAPSDARPPRNDFRARAFFGARKLRFFLDEGASVVVDGARGDDGTVFVQQASIPAAVLSPADADKFAKSGGRPPRGPSAWETKVPKTVPQVSVSSEQYNRMVRMIQQGEKLRMKIDMDVQFFNKDLMGYNTVAEIPGSDLKDQVVMAGAHMDSWHSGTGATDNAAGDAVVMEAVRILKALNLQPRRTIRAALWSGEEEGIYGSKAYVTQHFGSFAPPVGTAAKGELVKKAEYDKISAYFNLDNGTGKIRGIYLQGNEKARPIFQDWLTPFKDMGASTITINNTGSTDHISFDAIGIPGFQFIQDEIEYGSRTHHSNQDVYDRLQADDLKQASIVLATFLYEASMRDEMIPRKELK